MPTNTRMESCLAEERGALVFWSPEVQQRKPGSKVQIIDVFSLHVVTGYTRDPQGRLLLEAQPSVAAGRSWSLAIVIPHPSELQQAEALEQESVALSREVQELSRRLQSLSRQGWLEDIPPALLSGVQGEAA